MTGAMTTAEAAKVLGRPQGRVSKYCLRGLLKATKAPNGRDWLIDPESVRTFVPPKTGGSPGHHNGRPKGAKDKKKRKPRRDKGLKRTQKKILTPAKQREIRERIERLLGPDDAPQNDY